MKNELTTAAAEPEARKLPVIPPKNVKINVDGQRWREIEVRLPVDAVLDDLKDPRIWSMVQANRQTSLLKFDNLVIIAYDESWLVRCVVTEATRVGISVSKPVKTELPGASQRLAETPEYAMRWTGTGYVVMRKSDGAVVVAEVATPEESEKLMWALYSKVA